MDFPNSRNLARQFIRNQEFVGSKIREVPSKEIELILEMKLKATVIHEESEEYYESWVKEDHAT